MAGAAPNEDPGAPGPAEAWRQALDRVVPCCVVLKVRGAPACPPPPRPGPPAPLLRTPRRRPALVG